LASSPLGIGLAVFANETSYYYPRAWSHVYRHDLQRQVRLADQLGYDAIWLAEHHHSYSGYLPSDLQAAAFCMASSERIAIGTGVLLLPFHSAARISEGCAAIEAISPGRLRLGMGMGYADREFLAAGIDRKQRAALMEERLEELSSPEYGDRMGSTEFWIGAHAPKAIVRAGRFGCSLYFLQIGDPAWVREMRELWESNLAPRPKQVPQITVGNGIWASRDKRAVERARRRFTEMFVHYTRYMAQGIYMDFDEKTGRVLQRSRPDEPYHDPTESAAFGTPEEVIEKLAPMAGEGAVDSLIFYLQTPTTDGSELEEQLQLLAEEVVPHLRGLR
jgi:alkanesulfonate monooxygenase SsuD/methylene tetrahydromethanopterin reductase-like flavin-dependent oxidoreductase (luciferase family)